MKITENIGAGWSQDLPERSSAIGLIKVKVDLMPGDLFADLARMYEDELIRITRFEKKDNLIPEGSIERYFNTLLWCHVSNVSNSLNREYFFLKRRAVVPTPLYTILSQIGDVFDREFGIRFYPSFEIDAEQLLSPSEVEEIGNELLRLENLGLKLTTNGLPQPDNAGTLGFMGSYAYENEIRSYRHDNPVYGFYSAMFKTRGLEQALGLPALRVRYGLISHYEMLLMSYVHEGKRS